MKVRQIILPFLGVLCGTVAVTSAVAQVNYTWTGAVNGTNLDTAGNYTTNGVDPATTLPSGLDPSGFQESVIWDGRTTSNVVLTKTSSGWPNTGGGTIGVDFVTTTKQTNDVQLIGLPASGGIGLFSITNNSPHSSLILGTNWNSAINNVLLLTTRPAGTGDVVHFFVNNSTAPVILNGSVEWQAGGGSPFTIDFSGAGDFIANSALQAVNAAGIASLRVDGPGAVTWTKTGFGVGGPANVTLNGIGLVTIGSKLIVKTAGNFNAVFNPLVPVPTTITISNGASLVFDAALQSEVISRVITGGGSLVVSNGALTLTATNTYGGSTEIGGSSTLLFQGPKSGFGDITVSGGGVLGITDTGTQTTPNTLTLGAGATLEFNNVNNAAIAPLAAGTLVSAGTINININNSDALGFGQSYPLLTWTSGSAPAVSLGSVENAAGTLSTNGNTIQFDVATPLIWTGTNSVNWDTSSANWLQSGSPTTFADGSWVLFDDSAAGSAAVTVGTLVQPAAITVSNSALTYSIASFGGNKIAGTTGLIKKGTGTLTLSGGANSYTGRTTIREGTLSVSVLANGGVASDIGAAGSATNNLVLNGGALRFTGSAVGIDRLFMVGANGGTIDASGSGGPLSLNNPGTIILGGTLTLAGNSTDPNTLAASLAGSSGLNKSGPGTWVLTGTNAQGGGTTISGGVLQVGAGGGSGTLGSANITNNAALVFNRTGSLSVGGVISGTGSVTNNGSGTVVLAADNTWSGGTTINAGTLQIGNGIIGSAGKLNANGAVINNSALLFSSSGTFTLNGVLSGTGSFTIGSGTVILNATNTYTGPTVVNGATLIVNGGNVSTVTITSGTLGGTGTLSGPVTLGSSATVAPGASAGSIGTLTFSNSVNIGGNLFIEVDKSLVQSNDFVVIGGTLTNSGTGTVSVKNLGPNLVPGDKLTLFSGPVPNGAALNVTGSGVVWTNNLAVDGSISVVGFLPAPTLNFAPVSNNRIQLTWTGPFKLQTQTNSLGVGFSGNWTDVGSAFNNITLFIDTTTGVVLFRLAPAP
jgi:fibronectin-binding autotransporter adhesin